MYKLSFATSIYCLCASLGNGFQVPTPPSLRQIVNGKSAAVSSLLSSATTSASTTYFTHIPGSKFFQLEEMEDREACTTEIFLANNGSVSVIGTNGPPPIESFGTWTQKNKDTFEMTIVRTYGTGNKGTDVGEFNFDVHRTFEGDISTVGGLLSVTGPIRMKDDFFGDVNVGYFSMIDTTAAKLDQEERF
jgi:hypothetical protein